MVRPKVLVPASLAPVLRSRLFPTLMHDNPDPSIPLDRAPGARCNVERSSFSFPKCQVEAGLQVGDRRAVIRIRRTCVRAVHRSRLPRCSYFASLIALDPDGTTV